MFSPQSTMIVPFFKTRTHWRLIGTVEGIVFGDQAGTLPRALKVVVRRRFTIST